VSAHVDGHVAPGFGAVADEFRRNFELRGELGAACAVYHAGEKVVDLWGGHRDLVRRHPWEEDTLVLVYSTSKGLSAVTMALARDRGLFEYDEPVSLYWPEFAQNGKADITVRELLAHEAGLIRCRLDPHLLADHDAVAKLAASQRPAWKPGTRHGYHALSIGFYESALLRAVDPQRRSLGRYFRDEIADPLGIEFHFGLPDDVPASRIADIRGYRILAPLLHMGTMPPAMLMGFARPRSLTARAFCVGQLRSPGDLNRPDLRALEIPAGAGVGEVRGIARVYGELAVGGGALGIGERTLTQLMAPATQPSGGSIDLVLRVECAFSLGLLKPSPLFQFGSSERAFGHTGAGGSFGCADPDTELGFAYAPNRLGFHLRDDPREKPLRDAAFRAIGERPPRDAAPMARPA
jgi:CubicO group peptidase (beta-lactamase class C family)